MADNDKLSNAIHTIRPTKLGMPKPTGLTLQVAKVGAKLFRVEDGEVKVPRRRRTQDDTEFAWLGELEAPKTMFVFMPDPARPETAIEVEYNSELDLFEGPVKDDGTRDQYTGENVMEVGLPDAREVSGTPDDINKLHAAITRFNNRTGKRIVTRMVKDERDKSGRTLVQYREVYRTR